MRAYVASFNTAPATELCVRTLLGHAGAPVHLTVGDSGSRDRSLAMLRTLARARVIELDEAPGGRAHAEWLDRWLDACPTRYCVFSDSDVEYLQPGWLRSMLTVAERDGAAIVATRIQARDGVTYTHPVTGATRLLAARPEPWLMLIDVEQTRPLHSTFGYCDVVQPDGSKVAYDVAAAFYRDVVAAGLGVSEMDAGFQRAYRHYGGLSWQRGPGLPLRNLGRQAAKRVWVRARLFGARRRFPDTLIRGSAR